MRILTASEPAHGSGSNEDWVFASSSLIVMIDGATARTETGCVHGITWYATQLGSALSSLASDRKIPLTQALAMAIRHVADQHRQCDLSHPGAPSAAIAALRWNERSLEYLILGDITVVLDVSGQLQIVTDGRVDRTATNERATANRFPIGTPEKNEALIRMKRAELAARNRPDGYWIAASDPTVAEHAITDTTPATELRRLVALTDGAARIVVLFELMDWTGLLDLLAESGPNEVIRRTRALEAADPLGQRWPRNKRSDDATIVFAQ
jgi:hypothetical protein